MVREGVRACTGSELIWDWQACRHMKYHASTVFWWDNWAASARGSWRCFTYATLTGAQISLLCSIVLTIVCDDGSLLFSRAGRSGRTSLPLDLGMYVCVCSCVRACVCACVYVCVCVFMTDAVSFMLFVSQAPFYRCLFMIISGSCRYWRLRFNTKYKRGKTPPNCSNLCVKEVVSDLVQFFKAFRLLEKSLLYSIMYVRLGVGQSFRCNVCASTGLGGATNAWRGSTRFPSISYIYLSIVSLVCTCSFERPNAPTL